jgi:hypothetical protein
MDQFIRAQNVEHYRRLLERVTEESAARDRGISPTDNFQSSCRRATKAKRRWRSNLTHVAERVWNDG